MTGLMVVLLMSFSRMVSIFLVLRVIGLIVGNVYEI